MIYKLYAIKDRLTGFKPVIPFVGEQSDEMAKRYFETHMDHQAGDPIMWTHPEDLSLYSIGTYDTESGTIMMNPEGRPQILYTGEEAEAYANSNKN